MHNTQLINCLLWLFKKWCVIKVAIFVSSVRVWTSTNCKCSKLADPKTIQSTALWLWALAFLWSFSKPQKCRDCILHELQPELSLVSFSSTDFFGSGCWICSLQSKLNAHKLYIPKMCPSLWMTKVTEVILYQNMFSDICPNISMVLLFH